MLCRDKTAVYPLNKILCVPVYGLAFWELQFILKDSVVHIRHIIRVKWPLQLE
jgi:hypothetical protein